MRSKRDRRIEDLRQAVACLPVHTRLGMLEGIRHNTIIAGAYTDRNGGVCPMLAAHRHGGRTDLIAFARAWDRFTGAAKRSRPATERELGVLRAHLEASMLDEQDGEGLRTAVVDHQTAARRRRAWEAERLGLGWTREQAAGPAAAHEDPVDAVVLGAREPERVS